MSPTTPHAAAGIRIDPPVSVPIDACPIPVATAAADPPLDPPADRVGSCGLWTGPNADSSLVPGLRSVQQGQELAVFVVLVAVLLFRPRGLLGQEA